MQRVLDDSAALLLCWAATGTVLQPLEVRVNGESRIVILTIVLSRVLSSPIHPLLQLIPHRLRDLRGHRGNVGFDVLWGGGAHQGRGEARLAGDVL